MNLFILRHGLAVEQGTAGFSKDSERPLTSKGQRKLWKIAKALEAFEVTFDWILSSPYLRALQTAEIVADELGLQKKLELSDCLTPSGRTTELIELINKRRPPAEAILLVGHEPYLSELISLLVCGNKEMSVQMKKGGLCKLSIDALEHDRCAVLEWLVTPKQMGLMA